MKYILYVLVFTNQHGLELRRLDIDGATITRNPVTREIPSLLGENAVLSGIPLTLGSPSPLEDPYSFATSQMVASKDGRYLVMTQIRREGKTSAALIDWEEGTYRSLPQVYHTLHSFTENGNGAKFIASSSDYKHEYGKYTLLVKSLTLDETGTKWQERPIKLPDPPVPPQWNERLAELLPALDAQDAIGAEGYNDFSQYSLLKPWTTYDYLSIDGSVAMVEYRQSGNMSIAHRLGVATYESGWALKHLGNWTWIVRKEIHGDLVFVLGKRYGKALATLSIIRHTDGKLLLELFASDYCLAGHSRHTEYLRYQQMLDDEDADSKHGAARDVVRLGESRR